MDQGKKISLLRMFLLFMKIGAVTIGGGYVMIPLLQEEFVDKLEMMSVKDFVDVIAVAQAGPGGVAINASVVVGYKIAGLPGAIVATVGTVLPSFIAIILLAAYLLEHRETGVLEGFLAGARPAVVGVLFVAAYSLGKEVAEGYQTLVLGVAAFVALIFFGVHPAIIIVVAAVLGCVLRRAGRKDKRPGPPKEATRD